MVINGVGNLVSKMFSLPRVHMVDGHGATVGGDYGGMTVVTFLLRNGGENQRQVTMVTVGN